MIKEKIDQIIEGIDLGIEMPDYQIEYPPEGKGDYAINLALKLSSLLSRNPMEIAIEFKEKVEKSKDFQNIFEKIEIDHPGFINFFLKPNFLNKSIKEIIKEEDDFGKSKKEGKGKVQVEFISANPTGPLTLGNGRLGFYGDVLASSLKQAGYEVEREYYVNDIGNQVDILSESVLRKYLHKSGLQVPFPDYCYQGKYIEDLASKLRMYNYTLSSLSKIDVIKKKIRGQVLKLMLKEIQKEAAEIMEIKFDNYFFESSLYQEGLTDKLIEELKEKNLVYQKDGATWLKTADYGDDKNRVLIKENGDQTYFLSDVAYQYNKFQIRKFDKAIHVWGADHHGYVRRVKAAVEMTGHKGKAEFVIVQLVRLIRDGKEVRMSKRSGNFVTIKELVDEVGLDVARFFFLKYSVDTHMDFDLDLALEQSEKNPVFYVQYAHARICSIIKEIEREKINMPAKFKMEFIEGAEISLIKELIKFPDIIEEVAVSYAVHKLPNYATEVASKFHNFYNQCRVIDDGKLNPSRLELIKATRIVLKNVLLLMGISAPKKMEKKSRKPRYIV